MYHESTTCTIDPFVGIIRTTIVNLDDMIDAVKISSYRFVEWRDFINFLDNQKILFILNPNKIITLINILLYRKLLPANKTIYIKRKRNK